MNSSKDIFKNISGYCFSEIFRRTPPVPYGCLAMFRLWLVHGLLRKMFQEFLTWYFQKFLLRLLAEMRRMIAPRTSPWVSFNDPFTNSSMDFTRHLSGNSSKDLGVFPVIVSRILSVLPGFSSSRYSFRDFFWNSSMYFSRMLPGVPTDISQ